MRLLALIAAATLVIAACDAAPSPAETSTPDVEQIALLTQPPADPNAGCMGALATGRLALDPRSGIGIEHEPGRTNPVAWPNGYSAWLVNGVATLFDHQRAPLARVGDRIELGGGSGTDGIFYTCHGDLTVVE